MKYFSCLWEHRLPAENETRVALLDGQITSDWQNISRIITSAQYSEAFRFLASGSIQCSFANETCNTLRVCAMNCVRSSQAPIAIQNLCPRAC